MGLSIWIFCDLGCSKVEIFWGLLWTNLGLIRKVISLGYSLIAELGISKRGIFDWIAQIPEWEDFWGYPQKLRV